MDGIPALDLLDLVREVFQCSPNQLNNTKGQVQGNLSRNTTSNKHTQNKTKVPTQHDNFDLNNVDCVPSNAKFSRFGTVLYIFENNEAMIKMIIKGRSPTMRHVSRTHRVALDWLFDRINLDHQNQIKYAGTKHQLADILTKGNFTRDECNNLLYLFNISHFSSLCCAQNFSLTSCTKTMARRMQEQEGDNRIVVKSKPTTMNLAFSVSTGSSTVNSPIASKSLGILKAPCRTDWSSTGKPDANDRNLDAASSSQGWQKDAFLDLCTEKLVATEEDQEHLNFPEDSVSTGETCRPRISRKSRSQSNSKEGSSSCQCTMKIDWTKRGKTYCVANALKTTDNARRFTQGHWSFLEPRSEKKWCGTKVNKLDGEWHKTAEGMMLNFAESGHPVLRASSALERGELKSKGKGVKSMIFNCSCETIELILRTVISVNQLSVYRVVPDLCKELPRDSSGAEKPAVNENLESMVIPPEFPTASPICQTDAELQRMLLRAYERKFAENFLNNRNGPNSAPTLVFRRIFTMDNSSLHSMKKDLTI